MKPDVILVGHADIGKTTTTRMIEALEKMDKTVLVVDENEMPDFIKERGINITPYPSKPIIPELISGDYLYSNYGNKMSSRAARRKKERDSKKRKRK